MLKCLYFLFDINKAFKILSNYFIFILFILSIIAIFSFFCYNTKQIKKYIIRYSFINKGNNINRTNKSNEYLSENNKKSNEFLYKIKSNSKSELTIKSQQYRKNILSKTKLITQKEKNSKFNIEKKLKLKHEINNIIKNKFNFNDTEMNSLEYAEAKVFDKRSYCQYYLSLIRMQHILIFTFCQFRDYNSIAIKIYMFFLTFGINYLVSAMFYTDSTMHKIYVDQGSFDFSYQLPQMIYSFLISTILSSILNTLGLYEENIISFKRAKNKIINSKKVIYYIRCKIILFFIITYIILLFLWIYLGCFNSVYKNTQKHLLLDVLSSFVISFISPFFLYLLPGVFRIPSLKKHVDGALMFKFSKLLQLFL